MGESSIDNIIGVKNQVSDNTILSGLWISSVIGIGVTLLFCVLQRTSLLYKYRLVSGHARVKPPPLQEHGLMSLIDWAIKSVSVSDVAFVQSCGLDALIMVKVCSLGVQLFLPLCILGVVVLIPLHWTGGASKNLDADQSGFMRLTMANIPRGSQVFWVHVVFVYLYLAWAMVLLRWHYHQYLTIRQYYLRKGDDVNLWRALYEQKHQPAAAEGQGAKIGNLLRSVPLIKAFMPSGVPTPSSGAATPAKATDDEDEVYPLGGALSFRRRSGKDGASPTGALPSAPGAADGGPWRSGARHSDIVVRPAGPEGPRSELARRSLPPGAIRQYRVTSADCYAGPAGRHAGLGGGGGGRTLGGRGAQSMGPSEQRWATVGGGNSALLRRGGQPPHPYRTARASSIRLQPLPQRKLFVCASMERERAFAEGGRRSFGVERAANTGRGGSGGDSGGGGSGGGPEPIAEAVEGLQERAVAEAAEAATAMTAAAELPPQEPAPLTAQLETQQQQQQHAAAEPCGKSEVRMHLRKSRSRGNRSRVLGVTAVGGGSADLAARATLMEPDLETGLGPGPAAAAVEPAHGGGAAAADPRMLPPDAPAMSRGAAASAAAAASDSEPDPDALPPSSASGAMDPDAHLLRWWQERREVELPLGPVDTLRQQLMQTLGLGLGGAGGGKAERPHDGDDASGAREAGADGATGAAAAGEEEGVGIGTDGSGVTADPASGRVKVEVGVDLTRPSVGHRKTVNAEYADGVRVAVLAQHYAVLVTDVIERRAGDGARGNPALARSPGATGGGPAAEKAPSARRPPRRLASFLPRCLRSWCNLQYGNLAARKLDPALRAATSGEVLPGGGGAVSGTGLNRTLNTNLLAGGSVYPVRAPSDARLGPGLATSSRRLRSVNDPLPQPLLPPTLGKESWSAGREGTGPGGGAAGAGAVAPLPSPPPPAALRQPAAISRITLPNGGRSSGGGDTLIKLLELMARDARQKLTAHSMPAGAATAAAAAAAVAAAADAAGTARNSSGSASAAAVAAADVSQPPSLRAAAMPWPMASSASAASSTSASGRQGSAVATSAASTTGGLWGRRPRAASAVAGPVAEASEDQEQGVEEGGPTDEGGDDEDDAAVQPLQGGTREAGEEASGGASLRRRRGAAAVAPDGTGAHPASDTDGADGTDSPSDAPPAADGGTAGTAVSAAERWAFLREAVWSGEVTRLPWRSRYSVVSSTFLRLFPDEFDRAIPVINFKEVDLLLMQVDQHMAKYEYAVQYEEETGKQLFGRVGWCGLAGERRRLREYHREEINKLLVEVRKARLRAFDTAYAPSYFVFFRTQRAAAMAAQCIIHAEDNRQFRVHPAPGPDEVNWSTLWSNFRSRDLRRNLMRPLVVLVVVFPIGIFTGALTQLDYLLCPTHLCVKLELGSAQWTSAGCTQEIFRRESQQVTWDWYCDQRDPISRLLKRLVVAWLPSLLLVLWQGMVLPLVFTLVVQIGREARSLSEADRCIAKNMFYFAVFNVFLGGVAGSTIFQGINSAIEKGPSEIFNLVGTYVPTSSNFFINYTMFRTFVAVPLRMLWPHIGVRMYLIRRYLRCSCIITSRERAFLRAPVSPRYGFEVGMVMIIFLVGFAFSVVSPLLVVMALLFFAISWLFWRWALLYVYVRKYEGGGTMWPFVFNRVMVCMAIFPVFTACVFITKHAYVQAIFLLVTFPVVLIRFNAYCYHRFETGLQALPLEATVLAPHARVDPWVYTPPPLLFNLAGWHPDWSKCWMGWGLPVVYG